MRRTLHTLMSPFMRFVALESAGGLLLLACTLLALGLANSPWATAYAAFWHTPISLTLGTLHGEQDIHFWINEGLMTLFFLVVGLEIKREMVSGELASLQKAALPCFGALGGMLIPALLYSLWNPPGTPGNPGWGIPIATDIAFALAVLSLLGSRVPLGLKVFLVALAIVDDIGAILVIALFYAHGVVPSALAMAGVLWLGLWGLNRLKIHSLWPYLVLGIGLWTAMLQSGIHATLAGVLLAMTIPARRQRSRKAKLPGWQQGVQRFWQHLFPEPPSSSPPLQRLEHALHPWTTYGVLPLFALANAGVTLSGHSIGLALNHPVTTGIWVGLLLGKPVGITLFTWLSVQLKLARLPQGSTFWQIAAISILGGIGFTMSLFIADLSFADGPLPTCAKIGILLGSVLSGLAGGWLIHRTCPPVTPKTASPQIRLDTGE